MCNMEFTELRDILRRITDPRGESLVKALCESLTRMIDIGPEGGSAGGRIVFTGTPRQMIENSETVTAQYLRKSL